MLLCRCVVGIARRFLWRPQTGKRDCVEMVYRIGCIVKLPWFSLLTLFVVSIRSVHLKGTTDMFDPRNQTVIYLLIAGVITGVLTVSFVVQSAVYWLAEDDMSICLGSIYLANAIMTGIACIVCLVTAVNINRM